MKYCTQCGHANDDDALFCEKDGCRLDKTVEDIQSKDIKTQVCEKCGFENGMDMKFCGKCGSAFDKNKRKKDKNGGTPIVTVISLLFVVIVCLCVVAGSYDRDYFDWSEILQGSTKEKTYWNVICHHSEEIDMDGETINFSIDTNADLFNIKNVYIEVYYVNWETELPGYRGTDYRSKTVGYENYAKEPIVNIELVDDRSFRITVDRNRGYNRSFKLSVEDPKYGGISQRRFYFQQDGYKGICVVKR